MVWIGARDFDDNNKHIWHDGSELVYKKWAQGEPTHSYGGWHEDCVMMFKNKNYDWNDGVCGQKYHFICEKVLWY